MTGTKGHVKTSRVAWMQMFCCTQSFLHEAFCDVSIVACAYSYSTVLFGACEAHEGLWKGMHQAVVA